MKIGILCYPTYGGSGIVATELGMLLAEKGYEIHFISSSKPARLDMTIPNIYFHKVYVEAYPLFKHQPYDIALTSMIYHVVKTYHLDVIHAHYAIPYAYAAFTAKQMLKDDNIYTPLITTLHGTDITLVGQHPTYKKAVEFSINESDYVTSVSASLKEDTLKNFEIKKEIQVITNFIDNSEFNHLNICHREQLAEDDEKILIHVSNLRPVKRIQDVLEIFRQVNKEIPSKLIIIGEGPEAERVHSFQEEHPEMIPKIKLLGKVSQFYSILRCADVFLLPSEKESFGLAALEAMAAETPVISSNAGGIPEVNIHGKTGFCANVGDVDQMAKYALEILKNEDLLKEMKKNARINALRFDIGNIIPLYENLYEEAVAKNKILHSNA